MCLEQSKKRAIKPREKMDPEMAELLFDDSELDATEVGAVLARV